MKIKKNRWNNPLTAAQRAEIVELYAGGISSDWIGAKFGVHPAYVRKAAIRAGRRKRPVRT